MGWGLGVCYVVKEDKAYLIHSRQDQFRAGPKRPSAFHQNQYMCPSGEHLLWGHTYIYNSCSINFRQHSASAVISEGIRNKKKPDFEWNA